jgi:hypothetical protein
MGVDDDGAPLPVFRGVPWGYQVPGSLILTDSITKKILQNRKQVADESGGSPVILLEPSPLYVNKRC